MDDNFKYKTDKKSVVALGDVHCDWTVIHEFCKNYRDALIIQVGDFGLGFHHKIKEYHALKKLNKTLHASNNELIAMRGNHDDPARFKGKWIEEEILLADDYHIVEHGDKRIQLVGGGISIDRITRTIGKSWWAGEEVKFQPNRVEKVDTLITHVAPTYFPITKAQANDMVRHFHKLEMMQGNVDLYAELDQEKAVVQQISDLSECKNHYFGHYHQSHIFIDNEANRRYHCLSINEFKEVK